MLIVKIALCHSVKSSKLEKMKWWSMKISIAGDKMFKSQQKGGLHAPLLAEKNSLMLLRWCLSVMELKEVFIILYCLLENSDISWINQKFTAQINIVDEKKKWNKYTSKLYLSKHTCCHPAFLCVFEYAFTHRCIRLRMLKSSKSKAKWFWSFSFPGAIQPFLAWQSYLKLPFYL